MPDASRLEVRGWQHTCPKCGYENGFHISFRGDSRPDAGGESTVWLICPSCSAPFDVGLRVRLAAVPKA